MKSALIGFITCLFLFNCTKKEEKTVAKNIPYIISEENKTKIINNDTTPPPPKPPGWLVYGTNSFIIDNDSTVYYSQRKEVGRICISGIEEGDTIPYFIDLQPKDLIEIHKNYISDFIKTNYKTDFKNITFICSKTNTLKSKSFFALQNALKSNTQKGDFYHIRRTTQEEDTVLKYKKNNKYYDSEDIKWDKTKIKFLNYKIKA
ncbi:hypothetical protein [Flavobacterium sp. PL02]|uniref:hypothetical protein n=1 Tax=Flavobacterium sp. PL02 TaxID=3088354 RepID=UPI002B230581|nr:hypothetical protein [Flavobacterium sp. PL02]MEA9413348.1 hypothetical protein [Flavobacterium sp. PL02]